MGAMSKNTKTRARGASSQLSGDELLGLYTQMVRVREFEEQVHRSYLDGLVHGTTHLCQGQEAVPVGVLKALRADDYITYTYRGHGTCIARGMSMEGAFAEIFGRNTGVSKGLGGSMHLQDAKLNLLGSFGIVGGGLPVAGGAGLSAKLRGEGQVSVTFFGDGAVNNGAFHESLNIAAVWKLPVIYVCENNLYGEFTPVAVSTPFADLARRADGYDMAAEIVDGNDALAVYDAASRAVARARDGEGPTFIECKTYRHHGHSRTDPGKYRPDGELNAWLERDPVPNFRDLLMKKKLLDKAQDAALVGAIRDEVTAAAAAAAAADWPVPGDHRAETFVE